MMRGARLVFWGVTVLIVMSKAQADEAEPALLQFAEQYRRQNVKPETPTSDKAHNREKTAALLNKKHDGHRQVTSQTKPLKVAASTADRSNSKVSMTSLEKPAKKKLSEVKASIADKLRKPTNQDKAVGIMSLGRVDADAGKKNSIVNTVTKPDVPVKKPQSVSLLVWRGEVGSTLKDTVFYWSASQTCIDAGNWHVVWDTPVNYRIDTPLHFEGDFKTALKGIFGLYQHEQKPLYAFINSTQCLIKVTDKG